MIDNSFLIQIPQFIHAKCCLNLLGYDLLHIKANIVKTMKNYKNQSKLCIIKHKSFNETEKFQMKQLQHVNATV